MTDFDGDFRETIKDFLVRKIKSGTYDETIDSFVNFFKDGHDLILRFNVEFHKNDVFFMQKLHERANE